MMMCTRAVLVALAVVGACASCADQQQGHAYCAGGSYEKTTVTDADACCALCASEKQCKQWSFGGMTKACERTKEDSPVEKGITRLFSTCGIKAAPAPPPSPPSPPTPPAPGSKSTWAVIAAGSSGFDNYRHQADACHAYQQLLKSGVPAEQIILMMQDDVANSTENPFPGKLFNKPAADGVDVYAGCKIDYRGSVVTAKLFLSVITGDASGVPANGKVLKSGSNDRVFLNFVDHGGTGIVAFPNGPLLHAEQLSTALKTMHEKQMYSDLLFYMEACESGSMFPGLATDKKIFAVTASNAKESSWGFYCPPNDVVNGKHMGSCLGDLFSIAWMEDSDHGSFQSETIKTQVERVTKRTNKSHVSTFGDTSFESQPFGNFELKVGSAMSVESVDSAVSARDIPLMTAQYKYATAKTEWERQAAQAALTAITAARKADEDVFAGVAQKVCEHGKKGCVDELQAAKLAMTDTKCHMRLVNTVHEACPRRAAHNPGGWNGFNMKFSQLLVNACEMRAELGQDVAALQDAIQAECAASVAMEIVV